jgi:hypothetical protein
MTEVSLGRGLVFKQGGPIGEEVAEWRPMDVTQWKEDEVPISTFYSANSKNPRMRLYNRTIQPAFNLSSLQYFVPIETDAQRVARGLYPPAGGVNMEEQAARETIVRQRFLNSMVQREIPTSQSGMRYTPTGN